MGNHGSRRDQKKWGKHGGKAANTLTRVEELRGPSVDSYDKLIAWLAEMAENDNVELDTSMFVSQLNRVCGGQASNSLLGVSGANSSGGCTGSGATANGSGRRAPNVRQNSASCDSHVSHASSDLTPRQRSSTRSDDYLDPRSAWRSGVSTRQNTFSDDLEEEDSDVRNASQESLYSSTDRDSELGSMTAYDATSKRSARSYNFASSSPLLRATLANRYRCAKKGLINMPCSSSAGDLGMLASTNDSVDRYQPNRFLKRRSVSLLNLSPTAPIVPLDNIPKLVFTREDDDSFDETPTPPEHKNPRRKLGSGPKSLSLNSGKRRPAKFERQMSLHTDPNPLASMAASGVLPPIFSAPAVDTASGTTQGASSFLNDALLDGNIADILFSVEALWPKK